MPRPNEEDGEGEARAGEGGSGELVDGVDHVRVRLGRRRGELSIGSPPSAQFRLVWFGAQKAPERRRGGQRDGRAERR